MTWLAAFLVASLFWCAGFLDGYLRATGETWTACLQREIRALRREPRENLSRIGRVLQRWLAARKKEDKRMNTPTREGLDRLAGFLEQASSWLASVAPESSGDSFFVWADATRHAAALLRAFPIPAEGSTGELMECAAGHRVRKEAGQSSSRQQRRIS